MFYHTQSNTYIDGNRNEGFTINDKQFPKNWFELTPKDIREQEGFLDVVEEGTRLSSLEYNTTEHRVGNVIHIVNIRKTDDEIQEYVTDVIHEKLKMVRSVRELILNRLSGLGFAATIANDVNLIQACITARQSLLDITKDLPTTVQGVENTIAARYRSLVDQAMASAPSLELAFNSMDL